MCSPPRLPAALCCFQLPTHSTAATKRCDIQLRLAWLWLPVQMTDAEWADYIARQDDVQRKRIDAALAGGLPAVVSQPQQRQPDQAPAAAGGDR
jgi:hypothetical protein